MKRGQMSEPVYACSLDDEELAARVGDWRAIEDRGLLRVEPRPDGRVLVYRGGAGTARALERLIEAERDCCPFLDLRIDAGPDEILVTVTLDAASQAAVGPEDVARD
jgi:hypothetical protein